MKKVLTLGVSLALLITVCVPGTLAGQTDPQPVLVCEQGEHTHTDGCYKTAETPVCGLAEGDGAHIHGEGCYEEQRTLTCTLAEDESHTHGDDCYAAQRVLVCAQEESAGHFHEAGCYAKELICTLEEHTHGEACYRTADAENSEETAPPAPTPPVCACGSENGIHTAGCPLYQAPAAPEQSAHGEGCADGCTVENCPCPCHALRLFERLMACETLEEFWGLLEGYTDEKLEALLNEEQLLQLNEKLDSLLPPPAPKVIVEESVDNGSSDPTEDSKVIYPTVNYSNVAPFGEPVIG